MSTLDDIRVKVRRLTGRPSPQQITDDQIDEYINTFYQYDMPETLRLFTQNTVFEFMTEANVDQYDLRTMEVLNGSETVAAVDVYINISPPGYIAGYQSFWSQNRELFFRNYPMLQEIEMSVEGDGTPGPYEVTFPDFPVLQFQVRVGAIDENDDVQNLQDVPTNRSEGTWVVINTNTAVTGTVDYLTGAMSVTFPTNITSGNTVTFTAVPYQPNRPQAILFYDNIITLRPVPDASYSVQANAFKSPAKLLDADPNPELQQWWQYIAYGAAKKVFEDSQDPEGVNALMPAFKEQERLVLRRTIVQKTNQRSSTIYTEMVGFPYGNFNNRL